MKPLPKEATALLQQARSAHDPTAEQLERPLDMLHRSLEFALDEAPLDSRDRVGELGPSLQKGWLASRAAKVTLLAVAVGGFVGVGVVLQRPHAASVTRPQESSPTTEVALPQAPSPEQNDAARDDSTELAKAKNTTRETSPVESGKAAVTATAPKRQTRTGLSTPRKLSSVRQVHTDGTDTEAASLRSSTEQTVAASTPTVASEQETPPVRSVSTSPASMPGEFELIDGAVIGLRNHDAPRALRLLGEHAELYPTGRLTTERQGLRVLALCAAGQRDQALEERAAFLLREPRTPMADRVRRACQLEAP